VTLKSIRPTLYFSRLLGARRAASARLSACTGDRGGLGEDDTAFPRGARGVLISPAQSPRGPAASSGKQSPAKATNCILPSVMSLRRCSPALSSPRVLGSFGALAATLALIGACSSAGGGGGDAPTVADPGGVNGPPTVGAGGTAAQPGAPSGDLGPGDLVGQQPDKPAGQGCQQAARSFTPKIPTVFVMVDRSGTMFQTLNKPEDPQATAWSALRTGVLQVMTELQADVRFAFGAFSGQTPVCPDMPTVPPALNNQAAISQLYMSLNNSQYKDTPTVLALDRAAEELWKDPVEGDKFILFVTDGEPDYCDDGNQLCPPDSVVGRLQKLASGTEVDELGNPRAPIHTLVFGVTAPGTSILPAALQAFANAGAGAPVAPLNADPNAQYDQCNGVPGWAADFVLTGKPAARGQSIGDYSPVGGTTPFYSPDASNQELLVTQLRTALSEVKSCTFDLAGDGVEVDTTRTDLGDKAVINVNGTRVALDPANGWHLTSPTTVALEGAACDMWRSPGESSIDFDFPCDVIIVR
jgi:hypothetical protein